MKNIDARPRTIKELLDGVKYSIEYYQREYKWETRQITELLEDLSASFLNSYRKEHARAEVKKYEHYFLGSIVINDDSGKKYVIDGQQRLTSLTLLLIYLNNLQRDRLDQVPLDNMIFSEEYGTKTFNFDVPERAACIDALYNNRDFTPTHKNESVENILARYQDITDLFEDELKAEPLPYFIDWLRGNVHVAEITAFSDDEAYTIFETMNDRGYPLSPTDMLKGYLLSNIGGSDQKTEANETWRDHLLQLMATGKPEEAESLKADFLKAWLRAKYAVTNNTAKANAPKSDFDRIGKSFQKWVREKHKDMGLYEEANGVSYYDFVQTQFSRFSEHYLRIREASFALIPGLEYVFYNAMFGFTLQPTLVLAPIRQVDDMDTVDRKVRLVAGFLDIYIARSIWNGRVLGRAAVENSMYNLILEIRDKNISELTSILRQKIESMGDKFVASPFGLHMTNGFRVKYLLARITHHIQKQSGRSSNFKDYLRPDSSKPFEIEHIWADNFELHEHEFDQWHEFYYYRNHLGGLLLLHKGDNQSLGAKPYEEKVEAYNGENLLARSLNKKCYVSNPNFLTYVRNSDLPFKPYEHFTKQALDERQELYRRICEEIWSPTQFDKELQ